MAGITETKNRLPNEFVNNLYEMFTPGMVDNIFRGIAEKRLTTLRVNTLKYDIQSLMKYFKEINIDYNGNVIEKIYVDGKEINNNIIRVRRTNNKLVVKVNLFIGSFNFFHKKEYLRIYI